MKSNAVELKSPLAATVANLPKVSRIVSVAVQAAVSVNGQIVPSEIAITQAGNMFYVVASSAPSVSLQPLRAGNVGSTNAFGVGQGQPVDGGFETLTVKNFNLFPIVASVWVGFDSFINDQLIVSQAQNPQVSYPTYQTANSAAVVNINDISGNAFTDINGKKWYALYRVAILVFNLDSGVTLLLQKKGAVSSGGVSVGAIFPLTPLRFDFSGDYALNNGGGNINAIVSEIYSSIPA